MEELADYFSQRLANCQRQVYNVVNQVQSHVGDQPTTTNPSQVRSDFHCLVVLVQKSLEISWWWGDPIRGQILLKS